MGFNSTAATVTITAKLTPIGRQLMVRNNNSLITSFSLGDSDANYNASVALSTGEVPTGGGDVGPNSSVSNSVNPNANLKSVLVVNGNGVLKKLVENTSTTIISEQVLNGQVIDLSGTSLTQNTIDRNNYTTDPLVNLLYSFGLPLSYDDDVKFTGTTFASGGYSNTAFSALSKSNVVVFGIDNSQYGEILDGKAIKFVLPTSAGTYTMYSTYQNKGATLSSEDANYRDTSTATNIFGDNIAFLFSDTILQPNGGDTTLSWATGFNTLKPFSLNQKQLYNFRTDTNVGLTADTIVGVAYLDKGFLVITDPTIVADYGAVNTTGATTGATVTYNSVSTNVYQNVTCLASRGEFGSSTNSTYTGLENPRISEVGLYDSLGNLIAFGKSDKQIEKNVNELLALGIKITL
jgi:hypothetical protein